MTKAGSSAPKTAISDQTTKAALFRLHPVARAHLNTSMLVLFLRPGASVPMVDHLVCSDSGFS